MTQRKSFGSDNHAGAHPAVLRMLADANAGDEMPYGADSWTGRAAAELQARFGASGAFFVFNGTGANLLGLSLLLRSFDAVICPASAHINMDECGACERLLGAKLLTVPTSDGKLAPDHIADRLGGRVVQALNGGKKFVAWALRTQDLDALRDRLQGAGWELPAITEGSRKRPDGQVLSWRTQDIDSSPEPSSAGKLSGCR